MKEIKTPYFFNNPFYLIKASTRDGKAKLISLAEDASLIIEPEICNKARSDLSNPRTRVLSEISWFPGVSPKRCNELCDLPTIRIHEVETLSNLPPLAWANLYACLFEAVHGSEEISEISGLIIQFSKIIDKFSLEDIIRDINEDRLISAFPEINSHESVENAIAEQMKIYKSLVKEALDKFEPKKLIDIMDRVASHATENGNEPASGFIESLIETYEIEVHNILNSELENIKNLNAAILLKADSGVSNLSDDIQKTLKVAKNFVFLARPIVLLYKSRGMEHELSDSVARNLRNLGVDLHNNNGLTEASISITKSMKVIFSEIDELAETVEEDEKKLNELLDAKKESKEKAAQKAAELSYTAEVGLIFKEKIEISAEGIRYGSSYFPMEKVTRIGWGSISRSVNGIPTGTDYSIFFGDDSKLTTIDTRRQAVSDNVTDRLWKARGFEIMILIIDKLKSGRSISFKDITIWDDRVTLKRHKFFGSEELTCYWADTFTHSSNGDFFIQHRNDSKVYKNVPYISTPNVHVLGALLNVFYKNGGIKKISQVFD